MGSFASSLFSVMLSWIRGAVSYVWNVASSEQGGGMIRWLGENWLALTLILCAAGMVIDGVVHLFRWQPYKVWASFFRRITGQQEAYDEPPQRSARLVHRHWVYADGTARTEAVAQDELPPEEDTHPWQDVTPALTRYDLDEDAYRRQFARPEEQAAPAAGLEDYPQPVQIENEENEPEYQEEEAPVSRRNRRISRESTRMAFQQLFASRDEDELDLRYKPAQPAVDKAQAYNKPYYPPQWKPPAETGNINRDDEYTEER